MRFHLVLLVSIVMAAGPPNLALAQPPADIALYRAVRAGETSIVKDFLERGGDANTTIPNSPMADEKLLRIAYAGTREDIFIALIDAGANMDSAGLNLTIIGGSGMDKALKVLLRRQESIDQSAIEGALYTAIASGHYDSVEVFLDYINEQDWSLREIAPGAVGVAIGDDDIARLLMENGGLVNSAALRTAAMMSSPGMMRYLLQLGADPFEPYYRSSGVVRPQDGYTAIDWVWDAYQFGAPSQRQAAAFKLFDLINLGATSERVDPAAAVNGDELLSRIPTPSERLKAAAELGFYDTVKEILSVSTQMDPIVLTEATTAALSAGWEDIARLLLEAGAPPGGGPLHVAARVGSPGIVRLLLELGADPNEILDGFAPIDFWLRDDPAVLAAQSSTNSFVLRELIAGGAAVCGLVESHRDELRNQPSYTVLWHAAPQCWPDQR